MICWTYSCSWMKQYARLQKSSTKIPPCKNFLEWIVSRQETVLECQLQASCQTLSCQMGEKVTYATYYPSFTLIKTFGKDTSRWRWAI